MLPCLALEMLEFSSPPTGLALPRLRIDPGFLVAADLPNLPCLVLLLYEFWIARRSRFAELGLPR